MLLFWLLIRLFGDVPWQPDLFIITGRAQGTTYTIKYLAARPLVTQLEVDSIFGVIDLSLSLYEPASLINRFNKEGTVKMDGHMKQVVTMSMAVNKASEGGFDITTKTLSALWGFGMSKGPHIPTKREIRKAIRLVGGDKLIMRDDSLIAARKGVQIDCNGIAQGYTVDVIAAFLQGKGIIDQLVEVGGEVRASGKNAEGRSWQIGIESPSPIAGTWRPVKKTIGLDNKATTTSGNYNNYFTEQGKRYTHIIDPKTGRPVENGIIAVTVIARDAITADAWDNGFYVMGLERSFKKLENMPGVEAYFIYRDAKGVVRDTATKGFFNGVNQTR